VAQKNKSVLVPKLRFPEFRGARGWEMASLETVAERMATKNGNGEVTRVLTNSAEFGVLDQRDYFDRDIATAGKVDGYFVVDHGDYVYNPRTSAIAPVGPISRNNIGVGVMSPLYTVFRFVAAMTDFYEHYFKSTGWHAYLRSAASTGARHDRMSITPGAFMQMPVPTPHPGEQQKIADCLTSLDEVIAAQGRKVEALKKYKRGLMQQLFPREGETVPRLRFPAFRNAPEWKEQNLSAFIDLVSGLHLSPNEYRGTGEVPYFTGPSDFTNDAHSVAKWTEASANTARKHDTLVTVKGSGVGELWYLEMPSVAMGRQLMAVRAVSCSSSFVYQLLLTKRARFGDLAAGNLIPGLARGDILDMVAPVPQQDEQELVAHCLRFLDGQIAAETEKVDALKSQKQGLMQQLFPSPQEVHA
jgi:type I restriction enzyme, S subunit